MATTFVSISITKFSNSDLPLASVANMKKDAVYGVELIFIILQLWRARGGPHTSLVADILILSSPLGLLTCRTY